MPTRALKGNIEYLSMQVSKLKPAKNFR